MAAFNCTQPQLTKGDRRGACMRVYIWEGREGGRRCTKAQQVCPVVLAGESIGSDFQEQLVFIACLQTVGKRIFDSRSLKTCPCTSQVLLPLEVPPMPARRASHRVLPQTVKFGGCFPPPMNDRGGGLTSWEGEIAEERARVPAYRSPYQVFWEALRINNAEHSIWGSVDLPANVTGGRTSQNSTA